MIDGIARWTRWTGQRPIAGLEYLSLVAVSGLLLLISPYSFYSPAGTLDPWIPTSYFLAFEDTVLRFGYTYYASRMPYFVCGLALYKLFAPLVANFLLNLLFLAIAVVSLYAIAAISLPRVLAATLVFAFALNTYTAAAFVWDYPDGPAISFVLAGIAVCLAPGGVPDWRRFFYAGALFLMAYSTNLIAGLVVGPAAVWMWLSGPRQWRALATRAAALLAGLVAAFVVFGAVSKVLIDTSRFIGLQLDQFRYATRTPGYLSEMWGTGWLWIADSPRLWTLFGPLIVGVALLLIRQTARKDPLLLGAVLFNLAAATAFLWVEFGMQAVVLRVHYHSSYLIVPASVCTAFCAGWLTRQYAPYIEKHSATFILPVVVIAWAVPTFYGAIYPSSVVMAIATAAFVALFLTTASWALLRRFHAVIAIGFAATIVVGSTFDHSLRYVFSDNRPAFDAVVKTSEIFKGEVARGKVLRFWFEADEPLAPLFYSINSLDLWGWRDLTYGFGVISDATRRTSWSKHLTKPRIMENKEVELLFPIGTLVVHLTEDPGVVPARQRAMEKRGLHTVWRGTWSVDAEELHFLVVLTEVIALDPPQRPTESKL